MIHTSKESTATRRKIDELLQAAESASADESQIYRELASELAEQLEEYEEIRRGSINLFDLSSIDELGPAIIKARLARGWTQRQLAEALGVSEQMVQKDESRGYENAGLARLAEVADVLGYELHGELRPTHLSQASWRPAFTIVGSGSVTVGTIVASLAGVSVGALDLWSGMILPTGAIDPQFATYGYNSISYVARPKAQLSTGTSTEATVVHLPLSGVVS